MLGCGGEGAGQGENGPASSVAPYSGFDSLMRVGNVGAVQERVEKEFLLYLSPTLLLMVFLFLIFLACFTVVIQN